MKSAQGQRHIFSDALYVQAGATLVESAPAFVKQADIIFKVHHHKYTPSRISQRLRCCTRGRPILASFPFGRLENGDLCPAQDHRLFNGFIPRITRAQSMDALSSMSTVAGYKAVLLATEHLGKMFPLLMTAAGTITPATVLVLGAGVAGLQAIATAKRLGAK